MNPRYAGVLGASRATAVRPTFVARAALLAAIGLGGIGLTGCGGSSAASSGERSTTSASKSAKTTGSAGARTSTGTGTVTTALGAPKSTQTGTGTTLSCTSSGYVAGAPGAPGANGKSGKPASGTLSIPSLRKRYLALTVRSDKEFASFVTKLQALNNSTTAAQLATILLPAQRAITGAANGLWCLRLVAPPKVASTLRSVAVDDDLVDQALSYLGGGFGSRGFDLLGWASSFHQAAANANTGAGQLRRELKIG